MTIVKCPIENCKHNFAGECQLQVIHLGVFATMPANYDIPERALGEEVPYCTDEE